VARTRLREQQAPLDVFAELRRHLGEIPVGGLLLEHDERRHDVETRLDHGRELACEDLERLRLHPLEGRLRLTDRRGFGQAARYEAFLAQLLARGVLVGRQQLPEELDALRVDRAVRVRAH